VTKIRSLSATLTANQKSLERPPLLKLVLTKSGESTRTYDISSSANRIIASTHIEQEWSQIANVAVMSDATLAALSLEGYTGTISYGFNDATEGNEYSACAPLEVVAMKSDTLLGRSQTMLVTWFSLAGIFDLMQADKASDRYTQEDTDTQTVKTLLTKIANATLDPFTHCKNYTITFDSEDSLIDSYKPADYFYVAFNESRLSAFKKLIRTTKCKARVEDDGEIHVFNPTISGTSYDYEYELGAGNHNFFEKSTRQRLVIPTKYIVSSHPDHPPDEQFTGSATDSASETALERSLPSHKYIRATSDAECTNIATALLQHAQVGAEKGHGEVPMNCGQEVMDYIKITDSIAGDSRTGNVGYLKRDYTPGRGFKCQLRFGRLAQEMPFMSIPGTTTTGSVPEWAYAMAESILEAQLAIIENRERLIALENQSAVLGEVIPKLHVTDQLIIPVTVPEG